MPPSPEDIKETTTNERVARWHQQIGSYYLPPGNVPPPGRMGKAVNWFFDVSDPLKHGVMPSLFRTGARLYILGEVVTGLTIVGTMRILGVDAEKCSRMADIIMGPGNGVGR